MRVIKFRGKRVDNGEWAYGSYVFIKDFDGDYHAITDDGCVHKVVAPETVGQFTGRKDKNDTEIYEDDVVDFAKKETYCDCKGEGDLIYGNSFCPECGKRIESKDFVTRGKIVFEGGGYAYSYNELLLTGTVMRGLWQTHIAENYIEWNEVVGNIHDNPELIEKEVV